MNAARRKRAAKLLADLQPLIDAAVKARNAGCISAIRDLAEDEFKACGSLRVTPEARELNTAERELRRAIVDIISVRAALIQVKGDVE